jgi:flagellar basal-body rod protein FlgG
VRVVSTQKEFTEGSLQVTDNSLDVAINGRGFFEVLMPDGTTAYTRNGQFHLSRDGEVVNADGLVIQPAITVPPGTRSLTIGKDGTVSVVLPGESVAQQVGQITTTDFINPAGLEAIGGNLFIESTASGSPTNGTPGLDGLGTLAQGSLENSNVEVVEELVNMITTQRAYEMNAKVISTSDQMLGYITQNL